MKQRGFTLIELLTIIILIGTIAVVTTPFIFDTINDAEDTNIKNSGEGLLRAADTYYAMVLADDPSLGNQLFTFPNYYDGLELKGEIPTSGSLKIYVDGDIEMAVIYEEKYCVKKSKTEKNIIVSSNISNCTF